RPRVWLPAIEKAELTGFDLKKSKARKPTKDGKEREVPDIDFHDLRRAAGTALVRLGVDIKTAQVRLGHADPRTTMTLYVQATSEADQDAADRLEGRFFPEIAHVARTPNSEKEEALSEDRA
ncbi:MAG TPA: tyrosine-type recombinase/integrase, partial [Acidimicrobiales bacterium]|nr:tyrosine-type recombinase/integrase [Acidimicrobiales bacterium]